MQDFPHSSGLISPKGVVWTTGKAKGKVTVERRLNPALPVGFPRMFGDGQYFN